MKKKAIKVEYREDSQSFPQYLKYEITILNPDLTVETVPAYGRDLQDALSRVVHDEKVEKIASKVERFPAIFWIVMWLVYVTGMIQAYSITGNPVWMYAGVPAAVAVLTGVRYWSRKRNREIKVKKDLD